MGRELNLYIDTERGLLVSGFTSQVPTVLPAFNFGDSVPISARVLVPETAGSALPFKEFDLTDRAIRIGIGDPGGQPVSGTFRLTWEGDTTSALAYNASAVDVQSALNALTSIAGAGGVTVTKPADGSYKIVFNTAGARSDFSGDTSTLYPSTGAYFGVAQEGTVSVKESVLLNLETQPAAYVELSENLPVASIGVTVVRAGGSGVGEIQTIDLSSPEPYGGTFSLEIDGNSTPAITYNATAEELTGAIEAAHEDYVGKVSVTGTFPRYTVTFGSSLGAIGAAVADASDLVVPQGRKGTLNLNTAGVLELLNGESSTGAKFEIEIVNSYDSTSWTVVQQDCTVLQDVIPNSPASATPLPQFLDESALNAALAPFDKVFRWTLFGGSEFNSVSAVHWNRADSEANPAVLLDADTDAGLYVITLADPDDPEAIVTFTAGEKWHAAWKQFLGLDDYQKKRVPTYIESGANYDITPADSGDWLKLTHSADFTATLTEDEGWAWDPESDVITITNVSASYNLTIQPGSGVSLYGAALTDPTSGSGVLVLPPFASAQVASSGDSEFIVI